MSREEVCRKLFDLEKLIEKYSRDIPGSEMGLVHIRRAQELMKCKPERTAYGGEKKYLDKGILVE